MPQNIDLTSKKTQTIIKVTGVVVLGFIVSPFIIAAIHGIIGLAIAGALVGSGWVALPYLAIKASNMRLLGIKKAAADNPVETMQNIYANNMRTIGEKDQKVANFSARLGDLRSKTKMLQTKWGSEKVADYNGAITKMSIVLDGLLAKQRKAKLEAKAYKSSMEEATDFYQLSLDARGVMELAGSAEQEVFEQIKSKVAFDAITHSFNLAVSQLTVAADTDPDTFIADTSSRFALPGDVHGVDTLPSKTNFIDAEVVK